MEPGLLRDLLTLAVGFVSGILSGALGVGGAVVTTPGIRALGASAFVAVGTTLPAILPSAASGAARYAREGLVEWRVVAAAAPIGVVTAIGGSLLSHAVPGDGHWLMVLTAAIIGLVAVRMARREPPTSWITHWALRRNPAVAPAAVGAVAGALSGLLGIGGGTVLMPGFLEIGLRVKPAIATSLACVGILAVPGTVVHALLGDIDWRLALFLAVGVVPGARVGAALAIRTGNRNLRLAVAFLLGGIAVVYGAVELRDALR